jgi:hypothetical protein
MSVVMFESGFQYYPKRSENMPKQDNSFPIYYDGSSNVEFSDEIVKGLDEKQSEVTVNKEEWRRFISANPFGPIKNP